MATTTPAAKMTKNQTTLTAATISGYTKKAWNTIPHVPIRRGNGSTKNGNWEKKIEREDPPQCKKNKRARLEKDLDALDE